MIGPAGTFAAPSNDTKVPVFNSAQVLDKMVPVVDAEMAAAERENRYKKHVNCPSCGGKPGQCIY